MDKKSGSRSLWPRLGPTWQDNRSVVVNYRSLEQVSLTSLTPERTFRPGPIGTRHPPIAMGATSATLADMVFAGFPERDQGMSAQHFIIYNGLVISGHASDGVVIDAQGKLIEETARFAQFRGDKDYGEGQLQIHEGPIEKLAVFFDSAWTNYYHFLVLGIGKFGRFAQELAADVPTLLPAMNPAFDRGEVRMSRAAVNRMLDLTVNRRPTISLPVGAHRVGEINIFWPTSAQPASIVETDGYLEPFRNMDVMASSRAPNRPRRRLMIRRGGPDPRMEEAEMAMAQALSQSLGFEGLTLETLSFDEQVAAFAEAEAVVAPHGAGLANLVFCEPNCLIVELNRRLGDQSRLRPWFYQLAARRKMPYAGFNMDKGAVALEDAFEFVKSRL